MRLSEVHEFPHDLDDDQDELVGGVEVIPLAKADLFEDNDENALLARVPLLTTNPRKSEYLKWRTLGFHVKEACGLVGLDLSTLYKWRREDAEFERVEREELPTLQKTALKDLHLLMFSRNMAMVYHIDQRILLKAASGHLKHLTAIEYDYLKTAQSRYTPKNLIDLERSLGPEVVDQTNINASGNVVIVVDGRQMDTEAAKRAGARSLLEQFKVNKEQSNELTDEIEGEVVNSDD